ncbi:hypothetical protein PFISCL1PPCAC_23800 [Pristionchus fissidentatus]|uniref:Uncharacterized protein n=1 Tax=Pristionchus fissidentatus TaxID=1538716 RepID=A0AAV5WQG3_9BILA|nr:hypothetical protein PFISCL1PPCAC_23800 [Pristionchus fissidentatus]
MSARGAYLCQIQGCNVILIILGLGAAALAGSQFSRVGIDNFRDIDLRLLNWIHALTGFIGLISVHRNHGSIVTKTLYCVSIVMGIASAIFYGFTTYRVVEANRQLQQLSGANGFEQEFGQENANYAGRIAISATMIGISALAALVATIAVLVLDRLIVSTYPLYPIPIRDQERDLDKARKSVGSLAILKLALALGLVGLSAFLEYEHEMVEVDKYIQIALEHVAAMLAVCSAVVDLLAVRSKRHESLNLKVAVALSIIAATWCAKTVDNNAVPFYKNDLKNFYLARDNNDLNAISNTSPRFIVTVTHGVLLGCFCILFILCCFTGVATAAVLCINSETAHQRVIEQRGGKYHGRLISFLHAFWSACLLALTIIGYLDLVWRGEFLGGDLLWVSALFLATSIIYSGNHVAHSSAKFVMNVVCAGIAVEKMCASIHLIYEYAAYRTYRDNMVQETYIGQLVLICITTAVYAAALATSLWGSIMYGRETVAVRKHTFKHSTGVHLFFSVGTLFYAVIITGCYVVFELGKWRFEQVPIDNPFFRLGNGPFALCVFIVQIYCLTDWRLLTVSACLHTVLAALAQFTISPAISNVYYIANLISARDQIVVSTDVDAIWTVALILAAGATLACVIATTSSVIQAHRSMFLLHHGAGSNSSTVAPLEEHFGSMQGGSPMGSAVAATDAAEIAAGHAYYSHYGAAAPAAYSNHGMQTTMQQGGVLNPPMPMEEQSVYWSADENPFYYHTSKRYYGQPYQIESGFYGYPSSASVAHRHAARPLASSAAQTQLGHVFD